MYHFAYDDIDLFKIRERLKKMNDATYYLSERCFGCCVLRSHDFGIRQSTSKGPVKSIWSIRGKTGQPRANSEFCLVGGICGSLIRSNGGGSPVRSAREPVRASALCCS